MKTLIITIATKKYNVFLKPLFQSIKNNVIGNIDILVFTDESLTDTSIIQKTIVHEPWPFITLKRYHKLYENLDMIASYDVVMYIDSDMEFVEPFDTSNLINFQLFGVCHPSILFDKNFWPVEKNEKSTAFLRDDEKWIYHQGCLFGGRGKEFALMISSLKTNIDKDLNNDLIAIWHDESHMNHYFTKNKSKVVTLSASYCYPESYNLPIPKAIIHKDKNYTDYPRFAGVKQ